MKKTIDTNDLLAGLRAIAEPTRLRIGGFCSRADLSVTDLTELLGQSQPRISRHLKILTEAGILERAREGTFAFYRIAKGGVGKILADQILSLSDFTAQDARALELLKQKRHAVAAPLEAANAEQLKKLRQFYPAEKLIDQQLMQMVPMDTVQDLLDIGTGTGHMLSLFGPRVTHAMGIDLSRDMLSLARANLMLSDLQNCRVQQADMYHLPLDAASFDAVIIHHVLHYAEHPSQAIAEAARVLRPGGRLVIVDFIAHDQQRILAEFNHRWPGFTTDQLQTWCHDAHLKLSDPVIISEPGKKLQVVILAAESTAAHKRDPKKPSLMKKSRAA